MNNIAEIVKLALLEDVVQGDVSAELLADKVVQAHILCREKALVCGFAYAQSAFLQTDPNIQVEWQLPEGAMALKNQTCCWLTGSIKSILSSERVALNFLQTLSATATQTRFLVDKIAHTNAKLLDTRKTLPNLRHAQKQAVLFGGGVNHRMGLSDCVMIKENHLLGLGSIKKAVDLAVKKHPELPLIIEVGDLTQLREALALDNISRILCDNFSLKKLADAVGLAKNKIALEASGNIDENNIAQYAETGVDYISVGAVSKNIRAIDFSLIVV